MASVIIICAELNLKEDLHAEPTLLLQQELPGSPACGVANDFGQCAPSESVDVHSMDECGINWEMPSQQLDSHVSALRSASA